MTTSIKPAATTQTPPPLKVTLKEVRRLYDTLLRYFPSVRIGVIDKAFQFHIINGKDVAPVDLTTSSPRKNKVPHTALVQQALPKIKKAFEGKSIHHEVKSGKKFFRITAIPVADDKDLVNEILCIAVDITEQKCMEDELRKMLEKEKELGELKSRFVTMASHEFRTPLTSILASIFVIENYSGEDYDKEKQLHINRIKRSVNNLTTILNEFLSLQKLEENKVKLVQTAVNVPEYIQDELIGEMDVLRKAGQTITYRHLGNHTLAYLDHQIFWSIVTNLLSNAIKYSNSDDTITITSEIRDQALHLMVEDPGIGIPEDEHIYIFGRFYRARNALNIEGTGLGLHIIQKYVHLLKGSITFKSQLNKGTRFTVVLPDVLEPNTGTTAYKRSMMV